MESRRGSPSPDALDGCNAQGQYAVAEGGYRKALEIWRKVLGEDHPSTATGCINLASNLQDQGRYAAAAEGFHKALAIHRKALGEEHPDTANSYSGSAYNLNAQGKYAEAQRLYEMALAIRRKALGEEHPHTANGYNNLGLTLKEQGRYGAAEECFRRALDITRKTLGEEHPDTALICNNAAFSLHSQGHYAEAEKHWLRAVDSFVKARSRFAHSGLERATFTGAESPLPFLAAVLARNGKPGEAWRRFEESLARGTWDDLSARLRRPQAEQARQAALTARLDLLIGLPANLLVALRERHPGWQRLAERLRHQRLAPLAAHLAGARRLLVLPSAGCDQLPHAAKQLEAGLPVYDARLTAEEVLRTWNLNCELVTLSACQSALGRYERGEGFVGFAQAFLLAGSRAVCLSLWPVDAAATALLMQRFYANLLGRREGLKEPLGKVAALAEAKGWLRNLGGEEALALSASLRQGLVRKKDATAPPEGGEKAAFARGAKPYAHPYYWSAFVLIGDPE
jgi:tetratricopeptide (TPR) repeat protein